MSEMQELTPSGEIEPIEPEQARIILDQAMDDLLGENWRDDNSGWALITGHDYMARVTKGRRNIDFYVDLLGEVTIEEREISSAQSTGRTLFWILLFLSLAIAYSFLRAIGWL